MAEQQRKLISEGRAVPNAIQLLKGFEEALEKLEAHLHPPTRRARQEARLVRAPPARTRHTGR
jgi:hypothetical protein